MASVVTLPKFKAWVPVTGVPAASYSLRTYAAGTTTNQAVFVDAACTIPATNPVILDANGEAIIYAVAGILYKFALYDPTNTTQQAGWPVDNVTIAGGGAANQSTEWVSSLLTPTFISSSSFSVVGNQTALFAPGVRIQTTNTGGVLYSSVLTSAFAAGITTVTVVTDNGLFIDSGLSVVNVSSQNPINLSQPARTAIKISHASGTGLTSNTSYNLGKDLTPTNRLDTLSEWSTGAGTFTPKEKGVYLIQVQLNLTNLITAATTGGQIAIQIAAADVARFSYPAILESAANNAFYEWYAEEVVSMTLGQTANVVLLTPTFSAGTLSTLEQGGHPGVIIITRVA